MGDGDVGSETINLTTDSGSLCRRWEPDIHAPGTVLNDQFRGADVWELPRSSGRSASHKGRIPGPLAHGASLMRPCQARWIATSRPSHLPPSRRSMSRTLEPFGNARTASMPAWIRSFGKNRSTTDAVRTALSSHGWIRISFSVARTNQYGTTAHGAKRPFAVQEECGRKLA
jgi:hypothetical protein